MGMFDRLYRDRDHTSHADEWQTKAYRCGLDDYFIGDTMPPVEGTKDLSDYQVAILGETPEEQFTYSLATVRGDVLVAVHDERDPSLARLDYGGNVVEEAKP